MIKADWIAVDWGTSHIRVWAMSNTSQILAFDSNNKGMGQLKPHEFESVLLQLIDPWLRNDVITTVVACGMVGAKQGWIESAYHPCPVDLATLTKQGAMIQSPSLDPRIQVYIAGGVKQLSPADVMRGEETQVSGFYCDHPTFSGLVCLPGTHSKWVAFSEGHIQSFKTLMTGEIFALLSQQSILKHTVNATNGSTTEWNQTAFIASVKYAYNHPEDVLSALFSLRANDLLYGSDPTAAKAALSGYLIGNELRAMSTQLNASFAAGSYVALIGATGLTAHYSSALDCLGYVSKAFDSEKMTLNGLALNYQSLKTGAQ